MKLNYCVKSFQIWSFFGPYLNTFHTVSSAGDEVSRKEKFSNKLMQ